MTQRIALVISNQHQNGKAIDQELPRAVSRLTAGLLDPEIGNFDVVDSLHDVTVGELGDQIRTLFHYRKPYDFLLLYFLGRCFVDATGQHYLATVETIPSQLDETALQASFITDWMDRSFSRRQILIMDCTFLDAQAPAKISPESKGEANLDTSTVFKGTRRVILSAGDASQKTTIDDLLSSDWNEESLFSRYLLKGLESGRADIDRDGQIEVRELFDYIKNQIADHPGQPIPKLWTYGLGDRFIIASNPARLRDVQPVRLDLILGMLMAPLITLLFGWQADPIFSIMVAALFLLLYGTLYLAKI
jgi:hypothetical protein